MNYSSSSVKPYSKAGNYDEVDNKIAEERQRRLEKTKAIFQIGKKNNLPVELNRVIGSYLTGNDIRLSTTVPHTMTANHTGHVHNITGNHRRVNRASRAIAKFFGKKEQIIPR